MSLIELKNECEGWFLFEGVNKYTGKRRIIVDWFKNLITDQGLDRMGANLDYLTWCQVGSGDNPPANSDTSLETFVAATSTITSNIHTAQPGSPYYSSNTRVYRFSAGAAAGNLSEVGIGWTNGAGTLFSRALILDGGGLPTTITVLSDEFLDVTYQNRVYPPTSDVIGTITLDGNDYDYVLRAAAVTTAMPPFAPGWAGLGSAASIRSGNTGQGPATGAIAAITSLPSGVIGGWTTMTNASYGASNLYRDSTVIAGITLVGTVNAAIINFTWGSYQIGFTPGIPKTALNELSLTFRQSWARKTLP